MAFVSHFTTLML